ncbi:MAG: AGE family epimerase/isomerase [Balneolaceae bacterium]
MIKSDTASLLTFYRRHVEEMLLPFWEKALDTRYGGVYTCFNNRGDRLTSTNKYTWSQGRFLWLWAKTAAMISENRLKGDAAAYVEHLDKTVQFLEDHVFMQNGNCAFLLSESGEMLESIPGKGFDTSIYADCFIVIGLAAFSDLKKDVRRFEKTLALFNRIRERLETGEFRSEPYPVPPGYRAHSIPMIMLNVTQELAGAADTLVRPESGELNQQAVLYMEDVMDTFCRDDHRVVEMLPEEPTGKESLLYRHVNPGHTIESMWFVLHTALKSGRNTYIPKAVGAIEKAIDVGWDRDYGGLLRFVDKDGGKPRGNRVSDPFEEMIEDSWDMKLWWPHSEALYSTLLAASLTDSEKLADDHEKMRKYVFDTFPNPDRSVGEWIQIRDREGKPLDKVAALPVKDPFHILRNMLLILDLLENESRGTAI